MRALIEISTNLSKEELVKMFETLQILPNPRIPPSKINKYKNQILEEVSDSVREITEETYITMIYINNTWGLVNEPNNNKYVVRFKNPDKDKLTQTCTAFLSILDNRNEKLRTSENYKDICIEYNPELKIYESHNSTPIAYGEYIPNQNKLKYIKDRRSVEVTILTISAVLFSISAVFSYYFLSLPPTTVETKLFITLKGFIERVQTTTFVSMITAFIPIFIDYKKILKKSLITWKNQN